MEQGVDPFSFSKPSLLLNFSNCLAFETNLRGPGRVAPLPTLGSESAESAIFVLGLPELLGTIYDATAVAPGAHENDMKCDSF